MFEQFFLIPLLRLWRVPFVTSEFCRSRYVSGKPRPDCLKLSVLVAVLYGRPSST